MDNRSISSRHSILRRATRQMVIILFIIMTLIPPPSTLFPYTTLFRSIELRRAGRGHDARPPHGPLALRDMDEPGGRSEEHTSELQSQSKLVCRLLLEKKN